MRIIKKNIYRMFLYLFAAFLALYVGSWFLWKGPSVEGENFLNSNKIKYYSYYDGLVISKTEEISNKFDDPPPPFSLDYVPLPKSRIINESHVKYAHFFYMPIEIIAKQFNYQSLKYFYRVNYENLVTFNDLPKEEKEKKYRELKSKHNVILEDECYFRFLAKCKLEKNDKMLNYLGAYRWKTYLGYVFGITETSFKLEQFSLFAYYHPGTELFTYNFYEYKNVMEESLKFSEWFNNLNITENNPNFDIEFVKEYREFLELEIK